MPLTPSARWWAALALAPLLAAAQTAPATPSRIRAVTLYPGVATVVRQAPVAAGSRSLTLDCLPQALDARSLQVSASAGVRLGDLRVQLRERTLASDCASPLDTRVQAAEDRLALLRADQGALELAYHYLQAQAGPSAAAKPAPSASQWASQLEALRQTAQDTLVRLHQSQQRVQAQEQALNALQAERDQGAAPRVARVTIALAAEKAGTLSLSYQLRGPSWSPSYRAQLDTERAQVQIERLALVTQHTGEDWDDVPLTLSTGQPLRATSGRLPRPWTLDVQPPAPAPAPVALAAAPAPMAAQRKSTAMAAADTTDFEVQAVDGRYATEFILPQRVSVASGAQQVTLTLGQQPWPAQLRTRTAPLVQAQAWLVALLPVPEGIWPAGPVALYRDGTLVGQSRLDPAQAAQWREGLAFGMDERVQVTAEPVRDFSASAGFAGGRTERTIERAWRVDNLHPGPITLEVLDAAPVSRNEAIRVESSYTPAPTATAWNQQPGTIAWQQELAGGASAHFGARHVLQYDKGLALRERP